jgi:amino acid transporter
MSQIAATPAEGVPTVAETELKAGALRLPGVLMQSVTNIAPAIAVLFTIGFNTGLAGVTAPLTYLIALFIAVSLAIVLTQFARHLPSAGSYFTFTSRTVSPIWGWMVAWMYFLYTPIIGAQIGDGMGSVVQELTKSNWGFTFPWWLFLGLLTVIVAAVAYRGIELSTTLVIIFGLAEITIITSLAITGLLTPGPGGFNLHGFDPGHIHGLSNFSLAIIFSIFAVGGWDAAATLGEESENPRRTIPRAVLGAVILIGLYLIFCVWGLQVGWGTNNLPALANSTLLPGLAAAKHIWGGAWVIALIALINSVIAVAIVCMTMTTRIWYAMGRIGALPRPLAKVHPRYKTPTNAIAAQTLVTIILGFGVGFWFGPSDVYNVTGLMNLFALIPVYIIANYGIVRMYRGEFKSEFNIGLHVIAPLIGSAGLLWLLYKSLNPFPASPTKWAPIIVAVWLVLGVIITSIMLRLGKKQWLVKAGQAAHERPETSEELRHHIVGL